MHHAIAALGQGVENTRKRLGGAGFDVMEQDNAALIGLDLRQGFARQPGGIMDVAVIGHHIDRNCRDMTRGQMGDHGRAVAQAWEAKQRGDWATSRGSHRSKALFHLVFSRRSFQPPERQRV